MRQKNVPEQDILEYTNYNLDDITTPVKANCLKQPLIEANYDQEKTNYLVEGFTNCFSLKYKGPLTKQNALHQI